MKRILLIIGFLGFSLPCLASGISPVTQCTAAAATSCTLAATPPKNSILVSMNYRSNSATAPGTPTLTGHTFVVIKSETGNTNALKISWTFSQGNETTCGTSTNATQSFCEVYSGGFIASTTSGIVGTATSGTTGSSLTLSFPTFTLNNPLSTSWVVCAAGAASATNVDVAPTGLTLRSGTTLDNISFSDSNGAVSTWSTTTESISPTGVWATACFEIIGSPSSIAGLGTHLVHEWPFGNSAETTTTPFTFTYNVPSSLANNFLHVAFQWAYVTEPTVSNVYCNSDTGHATWTFTLGKSEPDTGNKSDGYDYYMANAPAGCTQINIVSSGATTSMEGEWQEWTGVLTSSPVEATAGQLISGSGPPQYFGPGSFSSGTLTTGDLILTHCAADQLNAFTDTGGVLFYTSSGMVSTYSDGFYALNSTAFIYNATAAPTIITAFAPSNTGMLCTALAVKTGNGGTAPAGVYIVNNHGYSVGTATTTVLQNTTFNSGDALFVGVFACITGNCAQYTAISDLLADSFTAEKPTNAGFGVPQWGITCNATAGDNTITLTGTSGSITTQFFIVEVAGLNTSGCIDTTAGFPTGAVTSGSAGPFPNMPDITPSTSGGIVFAGAVTGTGQGTAVTSPTGAIYACPEYSGQTDGSSMCRGNWFAYLLNTSTSAQNWTWTNTATTTAGADAFALESPAVSGGCGFMMLLGVGCQ